MSYEVYNSKIKTTKTMSTGAYKQAISAIGVYTKPT